MNTFSHCGLQSAEWSDRIKAYDMPEWRLHPATGAAAAELVDHLLHSHHRSLSERLLWIEMLLDKAAVQRPAGIHQWRSLTNKFAELHQELVNSLLQERGVIFPHIVHHKSGLSPGLRSAIGVVGKSHARCLTMLWALVDHVARAAPLAPPEAAEALAAELSDLRDDYYQYLYEEECLLFPQVVGQSKMSVGCAATNHAALGVLH